MLAFPPWEREMRHTAPFLASAYILCFAQPCHGDSNIIEKLMNAPVFSFSNNTLITNGGGLEADRIEINSSMIISNNGSINSDIFVCAGCNLYFKNSGKFTGTINLAPDAKLTQIITCSDDLTHLNVNADFDILVKNASDISLNEIISLNGAAGKITLADSAFVVNSNMPKFRRMIFTPEIELRGIIIIEAADATDILNNPLLSNVSGNGIVYINTPDRDPLYVLRGTVEGNSLVVNLVRSTDYATILGDSRGAFLNSLRDAGGDDRLFGALDTAKTMDELYSIMKDSVRINPINLMRPTKILNTIEMMHMSAAGKDENFTVAPVFVVSDNFTTHGLRAAVGGKITPNFGFEIFGRADTSEYKDDINEFSALTYGGGIKINYENPDIGFVHATGGASISRFEVGDVFDGTDATANPHGVSFYASGAAGREFTIGNLFSAAPFIGFNTQYFRVLRQSEFNISAITGTDLKFRINYDGIRYDYESRIYASNDGMIGAGFGIRIKSDADSITTGLNFDIIRDKDKIKTYNLCVKTSISF